MRKIAMNLEQMFIKIPNDLWKDQRLSDLDFAVYCMIQRNLTMREYSPISISVIYDMLQFNNRKYHNMIKQSLIKLADLDFIGYYDIRLNPLTNDYINNCKPTDILNIVSITTNESFFVITESEIIKIIELSKQVRNRMCFFRYFATICRITNNNNYKCKKAGFLSHRFINFFVKDRSTRLQYNTLFQDNKIFYYDSHYIDTRTNKNVATYFGRYEDFTKDEWNKFIKEQVEAKYDEVKYVEYEKQSEKRSIRSNSDTYLNHDEEGEVFNEYIDGIFG